MFSQKNKHGDLKQLDRSILTCRNQRKGPNCLIRKCRKTFLKRTLQNCIVTALTLKSERTEKDLKDKT